MHLALGLGTREMLREKDGREERGGGAGDIAIYFSFAKWLSHALKENMIVFRELAPPEKAFPKISVLSYTL